MSISRGGNTTNTSNTYNSSTSYTTVGLTGAQAVDALGRINNYGQSITDNAVAFQRIASSQANEALANLLSTTRDISTRAIAASTGQATPIENPNTTNSNKTLVYVALAGTAIALYMFSR
jgi:hypothetical protein